MRVLVVEDDPKVGRFVAEGLEAEGHAVDTSRTGHDGLRKARAGNYDLVLLDIGLPDMSGREVVTQLRAANVRTMVIIVTARSDVEERVKGLDAGADDYLTKPFSFVELLARIRALRRRTTTTQDPVLVAGNLRLDTTQHRLTREGELIELTPREYQLLEYLMRHPGETLSRAMLTDRVWGLSFDPGSNVVDVYVSYLRKKLTRDGRSPIRTVRAVGYVFTPESSEET
jgi:DNA-binding response OmpR family regulator